jgi:hypothetical protein
MPEMIRDGKGRGFLAAVTSENRMLTNAIDVPLRTHVSSLHGQSYTLNTSALTLSAINTWHWVLYFKNTSISRNLHISNLEFNWNGGSTNFNRPLQTNNVIPLAGAPTANHTAVNPSQNNHTTSNIAEMDVYKWDGVGAGMTVATGPAGADTFHSQGHSIVDLGGNIIMKFNDYVGLQVQSPEIGIFSVGIGLYFIDKDAEI